MASAATTPFAAPRAGSASSRFAAPACRAAVRGAVSPLPARRRGGVPAAPFARPSPRRRPRAASFTPRASDDDGAPPPSQFGGSRLIVPGMEGFDSSYGNPNVGRPTIPTPSNPGGGRGGPGGGGISVAPPGKPGAFPGGYDAPPKPGSEKNPDEAFAPFRPPSEFLDRADDFAAEDDSMSLMRLRQRAGIWWQLAPLIPKLTRSGMTPDDIFDETGVEPKEQSLWQTWTSARGSLAADPRFPEHKLEYFDQEWNAYNLTHIQYLVAETRAAFAEFVVDNEFDPEQTKELVKSVEIRSAHSSQARGFGVSPGECLAFKMWRDVQEVQRYQGMEAVMELVNKGKKYAENEESIERLDAMAEMWRIDMEDEALAEGGTMAKANAEARANISTVRLDKDELAFRPVPMLGPLEKLTADAVIAVQPIAPNGVFNTFAPAGAKNWVALPSWAALGEARTPFAVLVGNTGSLRGAGDLSQREEPALLIVDKAAQTPNPGFFYLAVRESKIQLAGMGGRNAEILDVFPGKEVMDMEREGTCTVIGRVVLAVRAPGGKGDGMTTEFVA